MVVSRQHSRPRDVGLATLPGPSPARVLTSGTALDSGVTGKPRTRLRASLEVPRKAGGIVREYAFDLYFPAQRLSWSKRWGCTPMLLLIEYLVYRVDAVTERAKDVDLDADRSSDPDAAARYRARLNAYKARFESILRAAHAYNQAVARQLDHAERFVHLENKATATRTVSHAEVLELAELRPSDVRLLHAMTFALLRRPVDQKLLDLLWPIEVLADIGNDLDHYRDDVAAGRFNTYDALVRLYGPAAPDVLRNDIVRYEKLFRRELAKFPADRRSELATLCNRRYRPRTRMIPGPILDCWQPTAAPETLHELGRPST